MFHMTARNWHRPHRSNLIRLPRGNMAPISNTFLLKYLRSMILPLSGNIQPISPRKVAVLSCSPWLLSYRCTSLRFKSGGKQGIPPLEMTSNETAGRGEILHSLFLGRYMCEHGLRCKHTQKHLKPGARGTAFVWL